MASDLLLGLLEIYVCIGIGLILGFIIRERRGVVITLLTKVSIYALVPVLVFISLVTTKKILDVPLVAGTIATQLSTSLLLLGITLALLRKRGMSRRKLGGYILIAMFPNATIFPLPIVLSVFGESFLAIIFLFSSSALVVRGTIGTYASIKLGGPGPGAGNEGKEGKEKKVDVKRTMIKLLTFPPTIAIIMAVIFVTLSIPLPGDALKVIKEPMSKVTSWLGSGIIGLILSKLKVDKLKEYRKDLPVTMLFRFVIPFLFFFLISRFMTFSEDGEIVKSILLLEVMGPPAIFNALFAINFDLDGDFVATIVVVLTLFMILLAPLIILVSPLLF
ncbi:MAG: AEC family transporter [Promethearchaeota archaeon]